MPKISPLAVIDPQARLADDVEVGPFCVVGANVSIGAGTRLLNNVTVIGHTTLGAGNILFPNCVIGAPPQDLKYKGEPTQVVIGDHNHLREAVTIHRGTAGGGGITRLGDHNLLMVNVHVGHDGQLGNHLVLANNVMLAGHVHIGDRVSMMGGVGLHHYVTVGELAYVAGYARIRRDVPPFVKVDDGDRVRAANSVGLARNGYGQDDIDLLEKIVHDLFVRDGRPPMAAAIRELESRADLHPLTRGIIESLKRRALHPHGRYLEGLRGH